MAKFKKGHKKVGGKKKGSKHKKTIEQELALNFLREKVRERWEELIDTKIELAKGIWVERKIKGNKIIVYQKQPDSQSLEYLFSMVAGKPKESLEVSGELKNKIELDDEQFKQLVQLINKQLKDNAT